MHYFTVQGVKAGKKKIKTSHRTKPAIRFTPTIRGQVLKYKHLTWQTRLPWRKIPHDTLKNYAQLLTLNQTRTYQSPFEQILYLYKLNMMLACQLKAAEWQFVCLATMTLSHNLSCQFSQPETLVAPLNSVQVKQMLLNFSLQTFKVEITATKRWKVLISWTWSARCVKY